MVRTALRQKLLRELWHIRTQMLSIILVVATGVMVVVTMRGSYEALDGARTSYYSRTRFADLWAPLVRAPEAVAAKVAALPGVQALDTRVTFLATLDLPGVAMPAQGRFVSLPEFGRPQLNDIQILEGRYLASAAANEVIISEKFAKARHVKPGDSLTVILNGRAQRLAVVGIASSAEHSYAVPPGSLLPEWDRYGVFWMSRSFLGPVYNMDGAFNELVLSLAKGANAAAVLKQVDHILDPYGGLGAYLRKNQLSHLVLNNELGEIRVMGTVIPGIFLGVAVFLLHQVLGRLISTQRSEIAVLKAFGYSNVATGLHYLSFAAVAVIAGAIIGGVGGVYLGDALVKLYAENFEIPALHYHLTPSLLGIAVAATVVGAGSGALLAVRRVIKLPPAEAMRPEAPARFKPGPLESLGLGTWLPTGGRMMLRNMERRPLHALFSVIGVALSLAILIVGMFLFDSLTYLMTMQFRIIQREDFALTFKDEVGEAVRFELAHFPGVTKVETFRLAPARLHAGHQEKEVMVTGLTLGSELRRVVDVAGKPRPFPSEGIVLSALLASNLKVKPGDSLGVEWLDGKRLQTTVVVTGTGEDFIGLSAYMSKGAMNAATGNSDLASGAYLRIDGADPAALFARLKKTPGVSGLSSPELMLASYHEQIAKNLTISSAFLLGFASILAFGVIYNSARIALSERGRELASLRVMGFHQREVSNLLLGEQGFITLLALPLGCGIGYFFTHLISAALETDSYRVPFVVLPQTYLSASLIIAFAALLSTLAVRRRLNRLELVSVLKTRE